MASLSQDAKRLMLLTVCISAVISIASSFFVADLIYFFLGAIAATVVSILKVVMMERALNRVLDMDKKSATSYARAQYGTRYFLTGVILFICAYNSTTALWGAVIGILSMPFAAYATRIFFKDKTKE